MSIGGGFNYLSQIQAAEAGASAYGGFGGGLGSSNYLSSLNMSNMLGHISAPSINTSFTAPTITMPTLANLQQDLQEYPETIGSLGETNPYFNASYAGALSGYYGGYGELGLSSELGYGTCSMSMYSMMDDPYSSQMVQCAMSGLCAGVCACGCAG